MFPAWRQLASWKSFITASQAVETVERNLLYFFYFLFLNKHKHLSLLNYLDMICGKSDVFGSYGSDRKTSNCRTNIEFIYAYFLNAQTSFFLK